MDDQPLQHMSTQLLMDVKEWRRAHLRATYVEIEDEVHKRIIRISGHNNFAHVKWDFHSSPERKKQKPSRSP